MNKRWMRIIEEGHDPDIGTALVRLAERAAEMHRAELAAHPLQADEGELRHGITPGPAAHDPHRLTRESDR